jgi:AIR synthase-related protein
MSEATGSPPDLAVLVARLQRQSGLLAKADIQAAARVFPHQPFPELGAAAQLGDDAAAVPGAAGSLLLACEGMHPELVREDPWFAGWSAVLVNLSDIAAMGGRPLALVNSLWCGDEGAAGPLLAGMAEACARFGVPMVGGHSNLASPYDALAVAVLGVLEGPPLSARAARAGDELWLLADPRGAFHRHYPFWDAATGAPSERLRDQLALLPDLARLGLSHAAKDVSMGGITGTAVMFAEAASLALEIDLAAVPRPAGVAEEAWLTCFPSFGFLLAVPPEGAPALRSEVRRFPELLAAPIGAFASGEAALVLRRGGERRTLWDGGSVLTGF